MPHLRITRQRYGVGMCRRGVLVHCPSRLRAAVAVLSAALLLSFRHSPSPEDTIAIEVAAGPRRFGMNGRRRSHICCVDC